jgi:hypothetical protein
VDYKGPNRILQLIAVVVAIGLTDWVINRVRGEREAKKHDLRHAQTPIDFRAYRKNGKELATRGIEGSGQGANTEG